MPHIAVGPVQAGFLKFFDHYFLLRFQHLRVDVQGPHPVAFQIECRFDVLRGEQLVEISHVVVCVGVVFAPGHLQRLVEIGDVLTPAEHQVLEQVREAGSGFVLVAAAHVVNNVEGHHRRIGIAVYVEAKSIIEQKTFVVYQSGKF